MKIKILNQTIKDLEEIVRRKDKYIKILEQDIKDQSQLISSLSMIDTKQKEINYITHIFNLPTKDRK